MALIVGLTGGIASGKSTVSNIFKELGTPVVDADLIARKVVEPNCKAYKAILDFFGEDILNDDRTIDRAKLGELIFNDSKKRKKLNDIVHPEVRKMMLHQKDKLVNEGNKIVILDIPLLFESNLSGLVDKTVVVYVDEMTQLERLRKRNELTTDAAISRIKSQMSIEEKTKQADIVIDNNGTINRTYYQVEKLLETWKEHF